MHNFIVVILNNREYLEFRNPRHAHHLSSDVIITSVNKPLLTLIFLVIKKFNVKKFNYNIKLFFLDKNLFEVEIKKFKIYYIFKFIIEKFTFMTYLFTKVK